MYGCMYPSICVNLCVRVCVCVRGRGRETERDRERETEREEERERPREGESVYICECLFVDQLPFSPLVCWTPLVLSGSLVFAGLMRAIRCACQRNFVADIPMSIFPCSDTNVSLYSNVPCSSCSRIYPQ